MTSYGIGSLSSPIIIEDSDDESDDARLVARQLQVDSAVPSPSSSTSPLGPGEVVAGPPAAASFDEEYDPPEQGFGYKMLASMGYESGLGLGPNLEGLVHPVRLNIRPMDPGTGVGVESGPAARAKRHQLLKRQRKRREKMRATEETLRASTAEAELIPHSPQSSSDELHLPANAALEKIQRKRETVSEPETIPGLPISDEDTPPTNLEPPPPWTPFPGIPPHVQHYDDPYGGWPEEYNNVIHNADMAFAEQAMIYGYFESSVPGMTSAGIGRRTPTSFMNAPGFTSVLPPPPMRFPLPPKPQFNPSVEATRIEAMAASSSFAPLSHTSDPVASVSTFPPVGEPPPTPFNILYLLHDPRTIGMSPDTKPNNTRGMFPLLLPPSQHARSLVMEILPRKFRSLAFINQWLSLSHLATPRIELADGKALLVFDTVDSAWHAWNSPRLGGKEGLEGVRLWWYRFQEPQGELEPGEVNGKDVASAEKPSKRSQRASNPSRVASSSVTVPIQSNPNATPIVPTSTAVFSIDGGTETGTHANNIQIVSAQPTYKEPAKPALSIPASILSPRPRPLQVASAGLSTANHGTLPHHPATSIMPYSQSHRPFPSPRLTSDMSGDDDVDMDVSSSPPAQRNVVTAFPTKQFLPSLSAESPLFSLAQGAVTFSNAPMPLSEQETLRARQKELEAKVAKARAELAMAVDLDPSRPMPVDVQERENSLRRLVLLSKRKREAGEAGGPADVSADPSALLEPGEQLAVQSAGLPSTGHSLSPPTLDDLAVSFITDAISHPPPSKRTKVDVSMDELVDRMNTHAQESKKLMGEMVAAKVKSVRARLRKEIEEHSRLHGLAKAEYTRRTTAREMATFRHPIAFPWPETNFSSVIIDISDSEDDDSEE